MVKNDILHLISFLSIKDKEKGSVDKRPGVDYSILNYDQFNSFNGYRHFSSGLYFYGRFLGKRIPLDNSVITPACCINDGVDYVPAKPALILAQHFSAIAAAGPIVGPIIACLWFGWLPALLWVVIGAVFIGGA